MSASLSARPASFSRVTITELMIPSYANFGGKIHGGILLSMMDKVAYTAATKHSGAYCVTVSVDTVDFLQPVEVGELVSLKASVNHVGNSSMIIGIKVISENVKTGVVKHTNTCYFTMVAKGEDDKRKKYKSEYGAILKELKRTWDQEAISTMLKGQRCEVSLDIK